MDPSLRNWGLASGTIDLTTSQVEITRLALVQPKEETSKQVRKNSKDMEIAELLFSGVIASVKEADFVFVEVPVGSQSARAMASYGVCIGLLGAMRASGHPMIEVTPTEVKTVMTGNRNATKTDMIEAAYKKHPKANWPFRNGVLVSKAEHMADAVGAIYAGLATPAFKHLLKLHRNPA